MITAPATPVASPPSNSHACLPPPSPALMASAAAMPSGHGLLAGNAGVSNMRYSSQASSSIARLTPTSIGITMSGSPNRNGMPMGRNRLLAAPKVADEMLVCARFCACTERKPRNMASGTRASVMAASAPMSEVLGVMPRLASIWMPTMAPNTLSTTVRIRLAGASAFGCSSEDGWADGSSRGGTAAVTSWFMVIP